MPPGWGNREEQEGGIVSVRYAILGMVSRRPLSGYDIKKAFAESTALYWSGNSNQVYPALLALRQEGLLASEVQQQDKYPAKKVYSITTEGLAELRRWLLSPPEAPRTRSAFLTQLAWSDLLSAEEVHGLLDLYQEEVGTRLLMQREKARRDRLGPRSTARATVIWDSIAGHDAALLECELRWLQELRTALGEVER